MSRGVWWCWLLLGAWGCANWEKAEALLPHPPVQRLEATDASGERRLVVLYPEANEQLSLALLSRTSVVATLKKRFARDTTLRQLQLSRQDDRTWLAVQTRDARGRVDVYWNPDQDELYTRSVPLLGGERVWSRSPPKSSPVHRLMETREADERRDTQERLRSCIQSGATLTEREQKWLGLERAFSGEQWLQVDGQTVGVAVFSADPTRVVVCREVSGRARLESLLPLHERCTAFGFAGRIWFADVAPPEGNELLAETTSIDCTGAHGGETTLVVYSSPLEAAKTRQILLETRESSIVGVSGAAEEKVDFKFTGKAGGYTVTATSRSRSSDTPSRRTRSTYVWSESQAEFIKK